MSAVDLIVSFQWQTVGLVRLDDLGKPVFPKVPPIAGIYSFEFPGDEPKSIYIGETDQLNRRFRHYRTPGPSQWTNLRINALIRGALERDLPVSVATVTSGTITIHGHSRQADLARKFERMLLENAALCAARASGISILNA